MNHATRICVIYQYSRMSVQENLTWSANTHEILIFRTNRRISVIITPSYGTQKRS